MPKIYERNPDTGEIREREFLMYDEDGMFTTEALQGDMMALKEKDIIIIWFFNIKPRNI